MAEKCELSSVTGLVLAGGRGSRMGGVDKGLQLFGRITLVERALQRLQQQQGGALGGLLINANRNLSTYTTLAVTSGAKVVVDTVLDFAGPLAGVLAGLEQCQTPFMLTVPCDSPFFPLDLGARLLQPLQTEFSKKTPLRIAMAAGSENNPQPVFCLIHIGLKDHLRDYLEQGGRKLSTWVEQHAYATVAFDEPSDSINAFANVNTLHELNALQNLKDYATPFAKNSRTVA